MKTKRPFTAATALVAIVTLSIGAAPARPAWFGPGSSPVISYRNDRGLAQVPLPTADPRGSHQQPASSQGRCTPNVELVGHDGVCPD
jgi:hypothetical protein